MISVSANLFRAACECRSTEETRYYLNGVFVRPHPVKGVLLVATDGHRLICLHDEVGQCDEAKIVGLDAKHIDAVTIKLMRKVTGEEPRLTIDKDGIASFGTFRSLGSCFIDGVYPDWPRVVMPVLSHAKKGQFAPATVNQKYLTGFGKIATMLFADGRADAPFRVVSFNEHDPLMIRFGSSDIAFGLLMPMLSPIPNLLPMFMQPILEPPAPKPANVKSSARKQIAKRPATRKAKKAVKRRAA